MTTEKKLMVAYYRVSTKRQGESGLGLEAQQSAVLSLVQQQGASLIAEFTEVESAGNAQRPQLEAAISRARRHKAVLVVAKADRLSRNVLFTAKLLESGVDFVACDNPYANRLTIHILSAIAEHERGMISDRTKVALAAAKARGVKLGSSRPGHWEGREGLRLKALETARAAATESHRRTSVEAYHDIAPRILELRAQGFGGDRIAKVLMEEKVPSRRGSNWTGAHVRRVIKRLAECSATEDTISNGSQL
jgi:DNA invertase Pin-like site-specific DNA recombinase